MKTFLIKALKEDPKIECKWYLDAEDKDQAIADFAKLMPTYTIQKVSEKETSNGDKS